MKAGKVVLNIELTPTQKSLKALQKSFEKIGQKLYMPFKKIGKLFSAGAIMGVGKRVADGLLGMAKKQIMEPITTLTEVLQKQIDLQDKGNRLGIGATKQANLDTKLASVGLGGRVGESLQSAFASALESGKLGRYQREGLVKGKDSADKLQSFLISLSKIKNPLQRAVMAQDVFGTELANSIQESLEFAPYTTGKGKNKKTVSFEDLVGGAISGNDKNDRQIFRAGIIQQRAQAKIGLLSANKTDNLQSMTREATSTTVDSFNRRIGDLNPDRIKAVADSMQLLNQTMTSIGNGLTSLIKSLNDLIYRIKTKGWRGLF